MSDENEFDIDADLKKSFELFDPPQQEREIRSRWKGVNLYGPDGLDQPEPVYEDYSAPTGSYGEKDEHDDKGMETSTHNQGVDESKNSKPAFSQLLSPGSSAYVVKYRYNREEILQYRHSDIFLHAWKEEHGEYIRKEFPEICRATSGVDLTEQDDENESGILFLRPYQEEVVERSLRGENDIILLPTGTGKTYVAIKVIIEHMQQKMADEEKVKVVFFVPTTDLASQQLRLLKKFIPLRWSRRCLKITGEDNFSAEMVKSFIKNTEHLVVVVTPAIIQNYFATSRDATISDFSLLVFDEFHHAKKRHNYNMVIRRYTREIFNNMSADDPTSLPQMIGMTATIGIGDSSTAEQARRYILNQCAKFNLKVAPCQGLSLEGFHQQPNEKYITVANGRSDGVSQYIMYNLIQWLEELIHSKVEETELADLLEKFEIPEEKCDQIYLQTITALESALIKFSHIRSVKDACHRCKVALLHLKGYYWCLYLNNLLPCHYAIKYLQSWKDKSEMKGDPEIWEHFEGNLGTLVELQQLEDRKHENHKVQRLQQELESLFEKDPDSKVIIFVEMRIVAEYLAELLNRLSTQFKANKYISEGHSHWDVAMNPRHRIDVRAHFEGNTYNILVATSVAEEGIDIQACNMVVRYMYVKDMIAKIQSRGRARKANGILLTILNEKLREQEMQNDFKEKLMFEALEEIRAMTKEMFSQEVQKQLRALRQTEEEKEQKIESVIEPGADVRVCCTMCTNFLGYLRDVRVYMRSHHPVLDASVSERVSVQKKRPKNMFDGIKGLGILQCSNKKDGSGHPCGCKVGVLTQLTKDFKFAMWKIDGIVLVIGDGKSTINPDKYLDIKESYAIKPLYIEDVPEVGPKYQFKLPTTE